ncbi:GGDEF domain-containing response regulator [Oceanirhabdus sp. W0125-5]|uniref:GGDEF domain-containing response regulator n=1 Tax=Oceanirhabdus sp. W0125-5 TaxID=2999116 RepID=UPI0022F309CD|nr:diguanylate cyclase [Oceanirhabdus sp. W0125-5]WBW96763.1 diguanylate cyclase [Oceanirhabdus sp. W0125-5]
MREKVDILIVDDLKENHLVMESVLTDEDLNLINAMSGEEALELCSNHSFAVILMDVQMPGLDGFQTAELLRKIEKTKKIPIIFVTAISKEKKSIFKGYEVGAVDYLFKPIDPLILRSKVNIFKELYLQRRLIEDIAQELENKIIELTNLKEEKCKLEDISLEDFLTGIYNRRGIDRMLEMHRRNCARYELPLSLIILDLDNFKNYNDMYGHVKGDEVLRKVAQSIKGALGRSEDFVGRYGGEEFLVVLPNTPLNGAIVIADRINNKLKELNIKHEKNNGYGHVTVSMGIASVFPKNNTNMEVIIKQADEMLYEAKENGKNQYKYIEL